MRNVQVTSESELLKGLAFPKNKSKSSLEKYRKRKSIPDLWDSTFTPKLPALPCLALPPRAGILPAQQSTQKPKVVLTALTPQPSPWSAALGRNQELGISVEMSVLLSFPLFGRGKRSHSRGSTGAAGTGGEGGWLRHPGQPPWGQKQPHCQLIPFPLQAGKVRWHLAVLQREAGDEMS